MILSQAPLRVSFGGGGTDQEVFYSQQPGQVFSATIDKHVYVLLNPTPLIDRFTVKYQKTEVASHPIHLEHTRIKAALLELGIVKGGLEIGTFADIPARTGLGSSSSFLVALLRGLHQHLGRRISRHELAELACRLEIDALAEPIGKQDQYAAAFGGFNVFRFLPDGKVEVQPIAINDSTCAQLEDYLVLFYTGLTRDAGSVLRKQRADTTKKYDVLKAMAAQVPAFVRAVQEGDMPSFGSLLHEAWELKKSITDSISNTTINDLYNLSRSEGAWGGKLLGAGAGGCLLLIVPPETRKALLKALSSAAKKAGLPEARAIPFRFVHSGCGIQYAR